MCHFHSKRNLFSAGLTLAPILPWLTILLLPIFARALTGETVISLGIRPGLSFWIGLPPKVVQERLGHATLAMTMDTYGHLFPVQVDTEQLNAAELRVISSSPSA
jgi:hypothetical protein